AGKVALPRAQASSPSPRRPVPPSPRPPVAPSPLHPAIASLQVQPPSITLDGRFAYAQLLVTARLAPRAGPTRDVTRQARAQLSAAVAAVSPEGLVRPVADGTATLRLEVSGRTAVVPVHVTGMATPQQV